MQDREKDLHIGSTATGIGGLVRVLLVLHLARLVGDDRQDSCHLNGRSDAVLGHRVDQIRRGIRCSRTFVSSATAGRRARHDGLDDLDSRRSPGECLSGEGKPNAGEGEGHGEGAKLHLVFGGCGFVGWFLFGVLFASETDVGVEYVSIPVTADKNCFGLDMWFRSR